MPWYVPKYGLKERESARAPISDMYLNTDSKVLLIPESTLIYIQARRCAGSRVCPAVFRAYADVCGRMRTYTGVCGRMLTYAGVCWRMLLIYKRAGVRKAECVLHFSERMRTYADVCWRMLTNAHVCCWYACVQVCGQLSVSCTFQSVCWRMRTNADECSRMLTYAHECSRMYMRAGVRAAECILHFAEHQSCSRASLNLHLN